MDKEFFSTTEAAKALGISRVAVFQKIKSGEIKAQKVGRNFIISKKDLFGAQGEILTEDKKQIIEKSVEKTVSEYGETIRLLGKE